MSINQDTAAEQYQLVYDALMAIAQDYEISDSASETALAAANRLTLQYIDNTIEDINKLNKQYAGFISEMEKVLANLENTLIDDALVVPLQNLLKQAKKHATGK